MQPLWREHEEQTSSSIIDHKPNTTTCVLVKSTKATSMALESKLPLIHKTKPMALPQKFLIQPFCYNWANQCYQKKYNRVQRNSQVTIAHFDTTSTSAYVWFWELDRGWIDFDKDDAAFRGAVLDKEKITLWICNIVLRSSEVLYNPSHADSPDCTIKLTATTKYTIHKCSVITFCSFHLAIHNSRDFYDFIQSLLVHD
jgi:hypothetical protein